MATVARVLGRASGQPPKPRGARRRREGLTRRRRAPSDNGLLPCFVATGVCCCPVVNEVRNYGFIHVIQGGALKRYTATRRINLYPVGTSPPYQGPSCNVRGHRAPRRMGPIYYATYCSPVQNRSHIHLGNGIFLSSSCDALFTLESRAFRYETGLEIAPKRDQ